MMAPRAIFFDLDDTILDDSGLVHECWHTACAAHEASLGAIGPAPAVEAIRRMSRWYWSDADRHRAGRLDLDEARREVVRLAFREMGLNDPDLANAIGDTYSAHRDTRMAPLPDAIETVRWVRSTGRRLALVTNGGGVAQRKKIERFGIGDLFDVTLVEGELGYGKPDARVYQQALSALNVDPSETWMIGDNIEFDVIAPKRLGLTGIWVDRRAAGVPPDAALHPDWTVPSLSAIRSLLR